METQRLELETLKYNLAKQKALGEFDIDPEEEEGEEVGGTRRACG